MFALFAAVTVKTQAQDGFVRSPHGDLVKILTNNTGPKIQLNDVVTLDVLQKTEKDSILFSTYTMGQPATIAVQPAQNMADPMEILPMLADKDSAYVKIPTDSLFKGHDEQRPAFLPKGSYIISLIKIHRVISLKEQNKIRDSLTAVETASAAKYIADNKLVLKTTPSGLKYMITQPSAKPKPLKGDTVFVNYTGYTLDGKIFDSSIESVAKKAGVDQPGRPYEPISFDIGTPNIIQAWNEAFLLLNEGAKAKLIIPSKLGYRDQGSPDGRITPFSTLVFDVELVKIKPIKHAAAPVKPAAKKPVAKKHMATAAKKSS